MKPDIDKVFSILKKVTPGLQAPLIELVDAQTHDPFKVLVATILTARTKDSLTATKLPGLWKHVKNKDDLAKIPVAKLEKLIYPIGFFKTKAKHLKKLPAALDDHFNGEIPDDVDELTKLPGVGRKTANLVVSVAFKKPAICVDTHVHRIMNRLGYIKSKDPLDTELQLRKKLPKKYWRPTNKYLVMFGQTICAPISPHCSNCPMQDQCKRIGVTKSR